MLENKERKKMVPVSEAQEEEKCNPEKVFYGAMMACSMGVVSVFTFPQQVATAAFCGGCVGGLCMCCWCNQ